MANYKVLARKYRPQKFADLIGQQHIAQTLQNAIFQNRIGHAYLFTGSRGVGKTTSARIFAKALNCEHAHYDDASKKFNWSSPNEVEPCNACARCEEITDSHAMDVFELDAASNNGVDQIREILEAVRYGATQSRYKIYIIDEVHMLSIGAFNALLKTLEEPPAGVVFILATTDPQKLPATIISRCQRYDFKRVQVDELVGHLGRIAREESIEIDEAALRLVARNARGGVRDSLSAMDQIIAFAQPPISEECAAEVLGVASRETLMRFLCAILAKDVSLALELIHKVDSYGQDLNKFSAEVLALIRDTTVYLASRSSSVTGELSDAEKHLLDENLAGTSIDRLQRLFSIWYEAADKITKNLSPRLLLEMTTIKMCQVETVVPLDAILRRLDMMAQVLSSGNAIPADALERAQAFLASQGTGIGSALGSTEKKTNAVVAAAPAFQSNVAQNLANHTEYNSKSASVESANRAGTANKVPAAEPSKGLTLESKPQPEKSVAKPLGGAEVKLPPVSQPTAEPINKEPVQPIAQNLMQSTAHAPVQNSERVQSTDLQDISDPLEDPMLQSMYLDSEEEISEDMMDAIRETDFSIDPDAEDDDDEDEGGGGSAGIIARSQKNVAVLTDGLKRPPLLDGVAAQHSRWKFLVSCLKPPLLTMMEHAVVSEFTQHQLVLTMSEAFRGIFSKRFEEQLTSEIRQQFNWGVNLRVVFEANADESSTLAAEVARELLSREESEKDQLRNHPLFLAVLKNFQLEPSSAHFSFNSDRISS